MKLPIASDLEITWCRNRHQLQLEVRHMPEQWRESGYKVFYHNETMICAAARPQITMSQDWSEMTIWLRGCVRGADLDIATFDCPSEKCAEYWFARGDSALHDFMWDARDLAPKPVQASAFKGTYRKTDRKDGSLFCICEANWDVEFVQDRSQASRTFEEF